MLTTARAFEGGITDFSMIHDSFATHAANSEDLADYIRLAFVGMYQRHDVLEQFRQTMQTRIGPGTTLPNPPRKGDLIITAVLDSPYFFA